LSFDNPLDGDTGGNVVYAVSRDSNRGKLLYGYANSSVSAIRDNRYLVQSLCLDKGFNNYVNKNNKKSLCYYNRFNKSNYSYHHYGIRNNINKVSKNENLCIKENKDDTNIIFSNNEVFYSNKDRESINNEGNIIFSRDNNIFSNDKDFYSNKDLNKFNKVDNNEGNNIFKDLNNNVGNKEGNNIFWDVFVSNCNNNFSIGHNGSDSFSISNNGSLSNKVVKVDHFLSRN